MNLAPIAQTLLATTLLTMAALTHANPAERMMQTALKLQELEDSGFKSVKAGEMKALRTEYKVAAEATQSLARTNVARLTAGKNPADVDKAVREADKKAQTPAKVIAVIDSMGGPFKAMQQVDSVFAEFNREALAGSQKFAFNFDAERLLMLALGVGDVQARTIMKAGSARCYFLMWVGRRSEQTAYDLCG